MSKLQASINLANVPTFEELKRFLDIYLRDLSSIINGNVIFNDNTRSQGIVCTFGSANVEQAFSHKLARTPVGFIVTGSLAATNVYNGSSANNDDTIYLRSSVATTVNVMVF